MGKRFVNRNVVVAPRVVGGSSGFDTCTSASCDGVDVYIVGQELVLGERKECELNGSGKASGVGDMFCATDCGFAV